MSCRGIAASSCPSARTPLCVCSCGGACHGGGGAKPVPHQMQALVALLFEMNAKGLTFTNPRVGYRPSRRKTLRKALKRAGLVLEHHYCLDGGWGFQGFFDQEMNIIWQEIADILTWMEMENPGMAPPPLSETVRAQLSDILMELGGSL